MSSKTSKSHTVETFDRVARLMALAGGVVLIFMVLLTVVDVFMRKVLNAPIFGGQDIAMMALVLVVFLGMTYCARLGGHIAVDLIAKAPPGLLRVLDLIVNLIGAFVIGALAWRAAIETYGNYFSGRATNLLLIVYWPFELAITICSAMFAVVLIYNSIRAARGLPPDKADG